MRGCGVQHDVSRSAPKWQSSHSLCVHLQHLHSLRQAVTLTAGLHCMSMKGSLRSALAGTHEALAVPVSLPQSEL